MYNFWNNLVNPDFLVIGAQKAGTTWLFQNLHSHPEIWLPPEKELHFFDIPLCMPIYWLLFAPFKRARAWTWNRMLRDWNKVKSGEGSLCWYWRYYFLPRNWWWYKSLFSPNTMQICGEATPRYATLGEKQIRKIQKRLPHLKIIYLLRDPIDRMWSDAAMQFTARFGGDGIEQASEEEIIGFLKEPGNLAHSRYFENLTRWERVFGREAVFVGFHEEIITNPEVLMKRVFSFLGVADDVEISQEVAQRKINQNSYSRIPIKTEQMIAEELVADVDCLQKKLESPHTKKWLNRLQALSSCRL